ncbi:MAG: hypothetical protein JJU37_08895 [Balneolaceae bacterium]|nr:hypothetical protein [Balneolaceae bacterium]
MKKVAIICDANKRAAIATIRALNNQGVELFLLFSDRKDKRNKIIFGEYSNSNNTFYYDKNSSSAFIQSLLNIKNRTGNFEMLPFGEKYVRWMSKYKSKLIDNGVTPHVASYDVYKQLSNKGEFLKTCSKYGINIPKRFQIDEINKTLLPFVVKPFKLKTGGKILKAPLLIRNENGFNDFIAKDLDYKEHIFESFIEGPSIYYSSYYNNGEKKVSFTQINTLQQPGGKSVIKAHPYFELPELIIDKIDNLFKGLEYQGIMMFELKQCQTSYNYYAIECNPRLWGPLQLTIENGVNFPAIMCGININQSNKADQNVGYYWRNGIFDGLFKKKIYNDDFQKFSNNNNVRYKDVWLRRDTFKYAIIEPILTLGAYLLQKKEG